MICKFWVIFISESHDKKYLDQKLKLEDILFKRKLQSKFPF